MGGGDAFTQRQTAHHEAGNRDRGKELAFGLLEAAVQQQFKQIAEKSLLAGVFKPVALEQLHHLTDHLGVLLKQLTVMDFLKSKVIVGVELECAEDFLDFVAGHVAPMGHESVINIPFLEIGDFFAERILHAAFVEALQTVDEVFGGIFAGKPLEAENIGLTAILIHQLGENDGAQPIESIFLVGHVVVSKDFHKGVENFGAAVLTVELLEVLAAQRLVADGVGREFLLKNTLTVKLAGISRFPDVVKSLAVIGMFKQRHGLAGGGVVFGLFLFGEFIAGFRRVFDMNNVAAVFDFTAQFKDL